jgi:hypothetical protein
MVNPAGLEPATGGVPARAARVGCCCCLGNNCSNSAELRVLRLVAETELEPASTDYESVPGGFTTPVYSASTFQTGYGGRTRTYVNEFQRLAPFQLGHSVRILELVDPARFERATSTSAESRSHSAELQVRKVGGGGRSRTCTRKARRFSKPLPYR